MTYLFVGAGQAGSAIVDAIFDRTGDSILGLFDSPDISTLGQPLVFNSTIRDLQNLSNVPRTAQYGIAEQNGFVAGTEPGFEEMVTGGFGRNPVKADEVMDDHAHQLQSILGEKFAGAADGDPVNAPIETDGGDPLDDDPFEETNADAEPSETTAEEPGVDDFEPAVEPAGGDESIQFVFLFLGLGGGTGCGIAPHIAREISAFTGDRAKIIAVGILPSTRNATKESEEDEVTAGRQAWNARYGLDRLEESVDGIILIDNQRISYLDSAGGQFGEYNEYVASALYDLIAGPVFSSVDPSAVEGVDTPDIDVRDIVTSLSFGLGTDETQAGYAAIGRSVAMTKSLPGYVLPFVGNRDVDSGVLTQLSTSKQTLADVDSADAKKAISLIRAPSSMIGSGDTGIETGTIKQYLEQRCELTEVNLGVALSDRNLASVTTLFTYRRDDLDRLQEIDRVATAYEEETEELLV